MDFAKFAAKFKAPEHPEDRSVGDGTGRIYRLEDLRDAGESQEVHPRAPLNLSARNVWELMQAGSDEFNQCSPYDDVNQGVGWDEFNQDSGWSDDQSLGLFDAFDVAQDWPDHHGLRDLADWDVERQPVQKAPARKTRTGKRGAKHLASV